MKRNAYAGRCRSCGAHVPAGFGWLASKSPTGRWEIVCDGCDPDDDYGYDYGPSPYGYARGPYQRVHTGHASDPFDSDPVIRAAQQAIAARRAQLAAEASIPPCLRALGLRPPVTSDDVRRRFRELAHEHHPDHGGNPGRFIEIRRAYVEAIRLAGGVA